MRNQQKERERLDSAVFDRQRWGLETFRGQDCCFWMEWRRVWSLKATRQRKARRDTGEPEYRQARGCHGDRLATPTAWLNCCLRPNPGKMLRGGCKASERRKHLIDRLSWQQDQALSSSIYLLREMGPTAFLLREEEPENRDFRVTTAPSSPRLPARRTRPVPPDPPCM